MNNVWISLWLLMGDTGLSPNCSQPLPSGRQLAAQVFLNPTYYQRLKHMVDFKIHSRGRGPLQVCKEGVWEKGGRDWRQEGGVLRTSDANC